ncbi:MAG: Rpn family recombination-promoting nuclease/putative transposase [Sulfurovum sp.]|nr:Rpn family recombination-promoting nuclease/putative transposase [Sulfurovum sp.]
MATYIDPFTDFGFKRIFGSEESKPLLISFLNDLLPITDKIVSLNFNKNEYTGMLKEDRKAIFDIHCKDEKDNMFIVELQRAGQTYFQDRALYYTSFPIREQATRGDWNFQLTPIYFVGILNFKVNDFKDDNYLHYGQITDRDTNNVMYDKLSFIYIELPKFKKTEKELSNHLEKWLWFFNELSELDEIPEGFKEDIIEKAFSLSELATMNPEKRKEYELSLKHYRDWVNTLDTAEAKGLEKGLAKGLEKGLAKGLEQGLEQGREEGEYKRNLEVAKNLLKSNIELDTIRLATGLEIEEIKNLK